MRKRKPNLILRTLWLTVVITLFRMAPQLLVGIPRGMFDTPEGVGEFFGAFTATLVMTFLPVGLVVLIIAMIVDGIEKAKAKKAKQAAARTDVF